jgi:TatD DNase family protein
MLNDVHANIDRYTDLQTEAIRQINQDQIITIGVSMDVQSHLTTVDISSTCPFLATTFGTHPWEANCYRNNLNQIDKYRERTPLIGEAGLDFHFVRDRELYSGQITSSWSWPLHPSQPSQLNSC